VRTSTTPTSAPSTVTWRDASQLAIRKEAHTAKGFHKELVEYLKNVLVDAEEQSLDEVKRMLRDTVGERNGEGKFYLVGLIVGYLLVSSVSDRQYCTYVWYHRVIRAILYVGYTNEANRREQEHKDKIEMASLNGKAVEMICIEGLTDREAKLLEAILLSLFGMFL
jgi:hypothetical protein